MSWLTKIKTMSQTYISLRLFIWVIGGFAAFTVGAFYFLGDHVIANDRLRESEDTRIEVKIDANQKEIKENLTKILVAIAQLQTKLDND